ncbi:GNAT family N-acetyltransferase, partial [Cylindrospermopsis raciborskii CS-506_C]
SLFHNTDTLEKISYGCRHYVDGLGAKRLAEYLKPTHQNQLRLRRARITDKWFYYAWVNDIEVRRQSFNSKPISWEEHEAWFDKKIADNDCYLCVLEASDLPIGQIRFDLKDEEALIDYSLDTLVRGRGWATSLVKMGVDTLDSLKPKYLRADVKSDNPASSAVFLRLGFQEEDPSFNQNLQSEPSIRTFRLPFYPTVKVG